MVTGMTERQQYDKQSLIDRGIGRAQALPSRLGVEPEALRGKRILEIGCGFGEHCAAAREMFRAEVVGIDPWPRIDDGPFAGGDFFVQEDITAPSVRTLGEFDFIASYDVFEHVEQPEKGIENVARLLRPGGVAFLKYNLYRGRSATHIVHRTNAPWAQLLLSPEEIEARYGIAPAWVNKLTYAHYLHYFARAGLSVEGEGYVWARIPDDFLQTHWEKLKAYPRDELDRDFMRVRLAKREHVTPPAS